MTEYIDWLEAQGTEAAGSELKRYRLEMLGGRRKPGRMTTIEDYQGEAHFRAKIDDLYDCPCAERAREMLGDPRESVTISADTSWISQN